MLLMVLGQWVNTGDKTTNLSSSSPWLGLYMPYHVVTL